MTRSRRPPAPHGARPPPPGRPPPSPGAPVTREPDPVDPPDAFDDDPDLPTDPATSRDSEQAPDRGRAGEESVRETGEDDWTDAERGGSRADTP
jgi:hypothetical protein